MEPPVSLRELATTGESVIMREFLPYSVRFETAYEPGSLEAVSYRGGKEISRDRLESTGEATLIRLKPEKTVLVADGHDALYVEVLITDAEGRTVPDAEVSLTASVKGEGSLAGFGSADPVTKDNYTSPETVTYRGRAMAILRSGYQSGRVILSVKGEGLKEAELEVPVEPLK
jgi:beta-galactosidase